MVCPKRITTTPDIELVLYEMTRRNNDLFTQSFNGTGTGSIGLLYIMFNLYTATHVGTYQAILHLTWWT